MPGALEPIRREERAVVVEGYFDLVALHRAGIRSGVATCGTAVTSEHARELRRRTRKVVLLFDGDEAGQKAMTRALEVLLPAELRVHAAVLPPGEDPEDFLVREGEEALRRLVDEAPEALEIVMRRVVASGVDSPAAKADAVASVAPLLVHIQSPVERGAWEERLALFVRANPDDVRAAVRAQRAGGNAHEALPVGPRFEPAEVRKLQQLARSLVEHPHLAARFQAQPLGEAQGTPVIELIHRLLGAADTDRRVDLEEISEGISAEARSLLYALASADHPLDEAVAAQTVDDTNRWLATRQAQTQQRDLTAKLHAGGDDAMEILRAKLAAAKPPPAARRH